jgi:predicted GNAT superfamily acetyltransferase
MSNSYKDYLVYKYNYDGAIEEDGAFLLYRFFPESSELNIGEIYVPYQKRMDGLATRLANQVSMVAKAKGLKYLSCQTEITGKGDEVSMMAILSYGFKPIRAEQNKITYIREVE